MHILFLKFYADKSFAFLEILLFAQFYVNVNRLYLLFVASCLQEDPRPILSFIITAKDCPLGPLQLFFSWLFIFFHLLFSSCTCELDYVCMIIHSNFFFI